MKKEDVKVVRKPSRSSEESPYFSDGGELRKSWENTWVSKWIREQRGPGRMGLKMVLGKERPVHQACRRGEHRASGSEPVNHGFPTPEVVLILFPQTVLLSSYPTACPASHVCVSLCTRPNPSPARSDEELRESCVEDPVHYRDRRK